MATGISPNLTTFFKTYLNPEVAYDAGFQLRGTLHAFNEPYVTNVKLGFLELLRTRELTVGQFEGITDVEFEDQDTLYAYLNEMYEHLYGDGRPKPLPPE